MYFLRKIIFHFLYAKKYIIFSGKRNAIFPDDKRMIIFQYDFFGKTILSEHLKNISYFLVFFEQNHLLFFAYRTRLHLRRKKYHLSWLYKKDHIPVHFFWKDHIFRTFGKRKIWFFVQFITLPLTALQLFHLQGAMPLYWPPCTSHPTLT